MSAIGTRKLSPFTMTPARPKKLGREHHRWFFHPNRCDIRLGPERFRRLLKDFDQGLEVAWNPIHERWGIWMRDPKIQHPVCQGWKLMFFSQDEKGVYEPLDQRILAKLYARSAKQFGNLWEYWLRVEQEMERDREKRDDNHVTHMNQGAGDYFDFMKIKVGYGKSSGSKFQEYHQ